MVPIAATGQGIIGDPRTKHTHVYLDSLNGCRFPVVIEGNIGQERPAGILDAPMDYICPGAGRPIDVHIGGGAPGTGKIGKSKPRKSHKNIRANSRTDAVRDDIKIVGDHIEMARAWPIPGGTAP